MKTLLILLLLLFLLVPDTRATSYAIFQTDGSGGLTMDPSAFVSVLLVGLIAILGSAAAVWVMVIGVRHFLNLLSGSGVGGRSVKVTGGGALGGKGPGAAEADTAETVAEIL